MKKTRSLAAIFLLVILSAVHQHALAQVGGFTLEQVLSSPFPSGLTTSKSGQRAAWVFDSEGRRNIWVAEGPQFQPRQLTRYGDDDGQQIGDLAFTSDGNWIVYVRGGDKNRAGEYPNPTHEAEGVKQEVFAVSWRDAQVRALGEGSGPVVSPVGSQVVFQRDGQLWVARLDQPRGEARQLFQARGSSGGARWSPDGRQVAFVSGRGDHSFVGVYDLTTRAVRFVAPSVDRDSHPRWAPDGRRIAFVRRPAVGNQSPSFLDDTPDPWAIMVADLSTGEAREVWRSARGPEGSVPTMAGDDLLAWAAGERLVFLSEHDGWQHLYSTPARGGEAALLSPGACEVEQMTITHDRRAVVYSSNCGDPDRRHLWRVAVEGGPPAALTSGERLQWSPRLTGDGAHVVYLASDARRPAMPHVMPSAGGTGRVLAATALPRDFPSAALVAPQAVTFKAADGQEVRGQLFLPAGARAGARLPAVIFMHGGPIRQMLLGWHNRGYYHKAYGFNQYLASRGYAVLSVNYRSGIGQGRAFRMAPKRGARGASEYQDILAAARYLKNRDDVDDKKIGLWGGSYGGYLTALALARDSDTFAAGVDLHGVHDWSQRISGASWIDYNSQDATKVAREASPISSVSKWRSPVLLIHGDDDRNVAFNQTVDLARRLREHNVPFEQLVFPDEVHDFLLHRHWLQAYAATADFFDRHLKGR